ncbi:hypothetical protein RB195_000831 [Necator americanus]|uniref:SCP domain-containing protein n=1 Tax=Necator americanus TaxID=51031 RepID=A0ABR1DD95_NECAM
MLLLAKVVKERKKERTEVMNEDLALVSSSAARDEALRWCWNSDELVDFKRASKSMGLRVLTDETFLKMAEVWAKAFSSNNQPP